HQRNLTASITKAMSRPSVRNKCRRAAKRRESDAEFSKLKLARARSAERRERISKAMQRFWDSEDGQAQKAVHSFKATRNWQTKEYAEKVVSNMAYALGNQKGMTGLEKKF